MKTIAIEGTLRDDLGTKSAKQLRREESVPCVIYGGKENIHFSTSNRNFKELLYTPMAHLVEITLGDKVYKAVIRDAQFHPVSDEILHVDFLETTPNKPFTVQVPINLIGNAKGVRNGGRMKVNLRKLRVKATEESLPEQINIDIENLRIGEAIRVEDVPTEGYVIDHEPQRTILTIQTARNAIVDDVEDEEGEEGAEGETAAAEGAEAPAEA